MTPTLIGKLIDRSVALAIACVMLWFVWQDNQKTRERQIELESYIREYIREDHTNAISVIEENTEVNKKLLALLEKQ